MSDQELNRRNFQRLTLAAFGGLVAGAVAAEARAAEPAKDVPKKDKNKNPLLGEPHICRGLNVCKGLGADKKNACAGQGVCATAKEHTCHTHNECRGQGGCGETPGENACKGKGECAVPVEDKTWEKARKRFEELMKEEGKKVGKAPAKPKKK